MSKQSFAFVCVSLFGFIVSSAFGSQQVTVCSKDTMQLLRQVNKKMMTCKNEIAQLELKNGEIEKDKAEFRRVMDSIVVPEYKTVTNFSYTASGTRVQTVRKIKYKQDARVRRLAKLLKDPRICRIYEKYCDGSCVELFEEFSGEWKMAKEGYSDTKEMLENNRKGYAAEIRKIDDGAKAEYEETVKEIDTKMAALKRQRTQYVINRRQLSADPPEVKEIDVELRELEAEKKQRVEFTKITNIPNRMRTQESGKRTRMMRYWHRQICAINSKVFIWFIIQS